MHRCQSAEILQVVRFGIGLLKLSDVSAYVR